MTTMSSLKDEYQPFMVDCETIGTRPNDAPVMQIALVSFNPETFEPMDELTVYLPLNEQIKAGKIADPGTVAWWGKQKAEVLNNILENMNKAGTMRQELNKITQWVTEKCREAGTPKKMAKSVFWAKPVGFDFPFIDGLFQFYKVVPAFHYREVMDMHTYIVSMFQAVFLSNFKYPLPRGAAVDMYWWFNDYMKELDKGVEDSSHNATADCYYQLHWLRLAHTHMMGLLNHYDQNQTVKDFKVK